MSRLDEVPDLTDTAWDLCPVRAPGLVVIVPARDEAQTLGPAMDTLLAQDYPWLRIVAVDDRSEDDTGRLLEEMAARRPDRLAVLNITELAEGWLGKTFAMEVAARQSYSDWLLFTNADVWFSPSLLRRALAFAEVRGIDHLVIVPSLMVRRWDESVFLGFLSVLGLWIQRPWRVADPKATWDAAGTGAFNLIRREAWEELDGFAPQRMAVLDGWTLGRRVRAAGMRQALAYAPALVLEHPVLPHAGRGPTTSAQRGMLGLARSLTNTLWAAVNFRLWAAFAAACAVLLLFFGPLVGLLWWRTFWPSLLFAACLAVQYRSMAEITGIEARWGWLYPLAGLGLLWATVRSVLVTTWGRGIRWHGTFYPLRELRQGNNPLTWENEAAGQRAQRRRVERGMKPSRWARGRDRLSFRRGRDT